MKLEEDNLTKDKNNNILNSNALMEGGFAVVDRERIIEKEMEEMEKASWGKNFINLFFSPSKMMKENFYQDPPQGMSIAVIGLLFFGILSMVLCYINPLFKEQIYEMYRMFGMDEAQLAEQYKMVQVVSTISAVFGVLGSGFITAIVLNTIRILLKLEGGFKVVFTAVLLAEVVQNAIYCLDLVVGNIIGVVGDVFTLKTLFEVAYLEQHVVLGIIISNISLNNICFICLTILGFKIITKSSSKKSIFVVMMMEFIYLGYQIGINKVGETIMTRLGI